MSIIFQHVIVPRLVHSTIQWSVIKSVVNVDVNIQLMASNASLVKMGITVFPILPMDNAERAFVIKEGLTAIFAIKLQVSDYASTSLESSRAKFALLFCSINTITHCVVL